MECAPGYTMLDHKTSLHKFKLTGIIAYIISDHNEITLEINKRTFRKCTNTEKLNNILFNNQGRNRQRNLKISSNENENTTYPNPWDTAKAVLKEEFIAVNACI